MGSSKIEMVNGALIELGAVILSSLTEDKLEVDVANEIYDEVYGDLLAKAPWRFAVKKADLSHLIAAPLNEWADQFDLPAQCVRVLGVYPRRTAYEIFGSTICANATALAVDYVERVSESLLPPPFVRLMSIELAVRMCMSITNDAELKRLLQQDARMQFAAALAADAQQRPNVPIQSSPFVDCRN
jgi:ethanolamine utilization microcompartment shell protein EutS